MNNRGKEAVEAQKQLIIELCKDRYPNSLDVSEIGIRTGWKINKLLIDDLVFVEIETENPYFDGDIYPNKYDYIKKRSENVIVKTV